MGVTKHTLFHYDEIGLFRPEKKGENGYRYYSMAQIEVFDVIYTLKDLDMPLSEIREYLDRRSAPVRDRPRRPAKSAGKAKADESQNASILFAETEEER